MPYTFNGIGTRYYGGRDRAEDGSYITTEWITFVYFPLVPIRFYRVLPVGKGTNIIIHSSQSYQTLRVPLCWPQVRNVYLCVSPILLLILYFNASDIKQWWKEDVTKSAVTQPDLQPEPPQAQPVEADMPLNSKDAACGKVLKLDKATLEAFNDRLDLFTRLPKIVADSGFTDEELKELFSAKELQEDAFSAYALAYLEWDKPAPAARADLDNALVKAIRSIDERNLPADQRARLDAYMVKYKSMWVKAFAIGRHDARTSPCPF